MIDFIIRDCKPDDLETIKKLQEKRAEENITYGFVPQNKTYLATKPGGYFVITEAADKILNFYRNHGFKSWYIQMFR